MSNMNIFRSATQLGIENSNSILIKDYSSPEPQERKDNFINEFSEKGSGHKSSKEVSPTKMQSNMMNSSFFSSNGTKRSIIVRINEELTVDFEDEQDEQDDLL